MTAGNSLVSKYFRGKRVLVTGGAGFIGSHLVEVLVELGSVVTVPVRETTQPTFLIRVEKEIIIVEADLFDRYATDSVMKGQEVVINLAAAKGGGISHSMRHHGTLFRDNILSFTQVIDAAQRASVGRFLAVSSACVYPHDARIPTPEEEGFRDAPEPTNAGYGWSKRMQEYLALAYGEEFGMNVAVVRPFNAYGPRDDFFRPTNHVIPGLITRVLDGENPFVVWGSGNQTRSFLYVTAFVRGVLEVCAQTNLTGPFNLGSDEEISIADLARLIVELSGLETTICFDVSKPDGQPRRACDTTKTKKAVGFQAAVSLREGLRRTMDWYLEEKRARNL